MVSLFLCGIHLHRCTVDSMIYLTTIFFLFLFRLVIVTSKDVLTVVNDNSAKKIILDEPSADMGDSEVLSSACSKPMLCSGNAIVKSSSQSAEIE